MNIKEYIKSKPKLKRIVYKFIMHSTKTRPNWWIRLFKILYIQKGRNSYIYRSVRFDITPFNSFCLGNNSIIEDYSCVNNAVGEIKIGDNTRIGLHNTIIGPVTIGNNVNIAQGVVISGMNHSFSDKSIKIIQQKISTSKITINDDVWIGANSVIVAGVTVGKHSVIGAGSIVTKDIPNNSLAFGNPAQVIKTI